MEKTKLNNISLLRLIATLSIFVFHIFFIISRREGKLFFPMYFGVQIFFFISAFLYSNKEITNFKDFYKKQFLKLAIPALVFLLLFFTAIAIVSLFTKDIIFSFLIYPKPQGFDIPVLGHLWFLPALFFDYLLLFLLKQIEKMIAIKQKYTKICFISFLIVLDIFYSFFAQIAIIPFLIGYYFGKHYQKQKELNINNKNRNIFISVVIFVLFSILYYLFNSRLIFIQSRELVKILAELFTCGLGVSFCILFVYAFEFLNQKQNIDKFFSYTDKYSFPFYFVQQVFLITKYGLFPVTPFLFLNILIAFVLTCAGSILLQIISHYISTSIEKSWVKH